MNKSHLQCAGMILAINLAMLLTATVFADDDMAFPAQTMSHEQTTDWVQHTQLTLDRLKDKLTLSPQQNNAWETWSRGVLSDARQQMEQKKTRHEDGEEQATSPDDETTPERMAHAIARLSAENSWMQKHLIQLQAAQIRTTAFYGSLNVNQRTIFDMFWREMHHRMEGESSKGMREPGMQQ